MEWKSFDGTNIDHTDKVQLMMKISCEADTGDCRIGVKSFEFVMRTDTCLTYISDKFFIHVMIKQGFTATGSQNKVNYIILYHILKLDGWCIDIR